MPSTRLVCTPHDGIMPKAELNALCAIYAYLLKKKAVESAPEPDSRDAAIVKNKGEVAM